MKSWLFLQMELASLSAWTERVIAALERDIPSPDTLRQEMLTIDEFEKTPLPLPVLLKPHPKDPPRRSREQKRLDRARMAEHSRRR